MALGYRPVVRDQQFLLPPDMAQWLPDDHLVWFVLDVVEALDTSAFHADRKVGGVGRRSYDPDMMLALLVFAYASGERSSRRIERLCGDHLAFRVVCAQDAPDHTSIARFRARHETALVGLFAQVLRLCADAGMVKVGVVAIDGTKVAANAARHANRSPEWVREQAAKIASTVVAEAAEVDAAEDAAAQDDSGTGDGVPEHLARRDGRVANLKKALAELAEREQADEQTVAAERADVERYLEDIAAGRRRIGPRPSGVDPILFAQARITLYQSRLDALHGVGGHKASRARGWAIKSLGEAHRDLATAETDRAAGVVADLRTKSQRHRANREKSGYRKPPHVNVTDPQSRLMTEGSGGGSIQGYNAQFAVTDDHCVLAVHVSQNPSDATSFTPTMTAAVEQAATLGAEIGILVLDAGYFSEENVTAQGPDRLIASGKTRKVLRQATNDPADEPPPPDLSPTDAMKHRLRQPKNIDTYKRRGATVEPVFGHLKDRIGLRRFSRRGLSAVTAELNLAASVLNLLRLHSLELAT